MDKSLGQIIKDHWSNLVIIFILIAIAIHIGTFNRDFEETYPEEVCYMWDNGWTQVDLILGCTNISNGEINVVCDFSIGPDYTLYLYEYKNPDNIYGTYGCWQFVPARLVPLDIEKIKAEFME